MKEFNLNITMFSIEELAISRGMRFEITSENGTHRSWHRTIEAAERQHARNLGYRCGICGSSKGGWGTCSHGTQARVCDAKHYNDKIEQIA